MGGSRTDRDVHFYTSTFMNEPLVVPGWRAEVRGTQSPMHQVVDRKLAVRKDLLQADADSRVTCPASHDSYVSDELMQNTAPPHLIEGRRCHCWSRPWRGGRRRKGEGKEERARSSARTRGEWTFCRLCTEQDMASGAERKESLLCNIWPGVVLSR